MDVTFALAALGYALLGLSVVLHAAAYKSHVQMRFLAGLVAVVVSWHVFRVWNERFGWSLDEAGRKGWAGFVVFHAALVLIVAAPMAPRVWLASLHGLAFPIASVGAVSAVFRYEVAEPYRAAVLAVLALTPAVGLFAAQVIRRTSQSPNRGER